MLTVFRLCGRHLRGVNQEPTPPSRSVLGLDGGACLRADRRYVARLGRGRRLEVAYVVCSEHGKRLLATRE